MGFKFRPERCCWNCRYSGFRRDKLGRRQAQYVGECMFVMPFLPECVSVSTKTPIADTSGQNCKVFVPENKN